MMVRFTSTAACAALLVALGACAGGGAQSDTSASTQTASPTAPSNTYSDAQVQSYIAARSAIGQLSPGSTTEAQRENQLRIGQILQQNNLTPDTYNAIAARAQTDQTLANRIAAASVGDEFTDAQLQAFVAAGIEIQPLNQQLATATPEQRTAIAEQIRGVLQRNNLSIEAYNGIAAQAQDDPELAARITAIHSAQTPAETPSE
jgi:hypothetical protein